MAESTIITVYRRDESEEIDRDSFAYFGKSIPIGGPS